MADDVRGSRIICGDCGSDNVLRDAWARWDPVTQSWEVAVVHSAGFCHDCDTETELWERPEGKGN
jgi:hypothetical protein